MTNEQKYVKIKIGTWIWAFLSDAHKLAVKYDTAHFCLEVSVLFHHLLCFEDIYYGRESKRQL